MFLGARVDVSTNTRCPKIDRVAPNIPSFLLTAITQVTVFQFLSLICLIDPWFVELLILSWSIAFSLCLINQRCVLDVSFIFVSFNDGLAFVGPYRAATQNATVHYLLMQYLCSKQLEEHNMPLLRINTYKTQKGIEQRYVLSKVSLNSIHLYI